MDTLDCSYLALYDNINIQHGKTVEHACMNTKIFLYFASLVPNNILDIYELGCCRIIDRSLSRSDNLTTGRVYCRIEYAWLVWYYDL